MLRWQCFSFKVRLCSDLFNGTDPDTLINTMVQFRMDSSTKPSAAIHCSLPALQPLVDAGAFPGAGGNECGARCCFTCCLWSPLFSWHIQAKVKHQVTVEKFDNSTPRPNSICMYLLWGWFPIMGSSCSVLRTGFRWHFFQCHVSATTNVPLFLQVALESFMILGMTIWLRLWRVWNLTDWYPLTTWMMDNGLSQHKLLMHS